MYYRLSNLRFDCNKTTVSFICTCSVGCQSFCLDFETLDSNFFCFFVCFGCFLACATNLDQGFYLVWNL